MEQPISVYI